MYQLSSFTFMGRVGKPLLFSHLLQKGKSMNHCNSTQNPFLLPHVSVSAMSRYLSYCCRPFYPMYFLFCQLHENALWGRSSEKYFMSNLSYKGFVAKSHCGGSRGFESWGWPPALVTPKIIFWWHLLLPEENKPVCLYLGGNISNWGLKFLICP